MSRRSAVASRSTSRGPGRDPVARPCLRSLWLLRQRTRDPLLEAGERRIRRQRQLRRVRGRPGERRVVPTASPPATPPVDLRRRDDYKAIKVANIVPGEQSPSSESVDWDTSPSSMPDRRRVGHRRRHRGGEARDGHRSRRRPCRQCPDYDPADAIQALGGADVAVALAARPEYSTRPFGRCAAADV